MKADYSKIHWTGGRLNDLNEKYKMNAAYKTVPVMKLIKAHHPKTWKELELLIVQHSREKCKCGIQSKGSIYDFATNLYRAIHHEAPEYTKQDCLDFIVGLFIQSSLKGSIMEQLAVTSLREYDAQLASDEEDRKYAVDVVIPERCGIQVKAVGYKGTSQRVKKVNEEKNSKYQYPVYYLYYDGDKFVNLEEVIENVDNGT